MFTKGHPFFKSEKTKLFKRGQVGYWTGKKLGFIPGGAWEKGHIPANKGIPMSDELKEKDKMGHLGKKASMETKKKMSLIHKGHKFSEEHNKKISEARKGEKCHFWKGGITPIHTIIRQSREYKIWRESVFLRDNYTCIWCGQKGGRIQADHIKPFCDYPELRFAIDNGRTLCVDCHKTTETYGWKEVNKFKER